MSTLAATLEHELRGVNEEITRLEAEATTGKEAADKIVADFKAKGINPLTDDVAFKQVEEAFAVPDSARQKIVELRRRRETVMGQHGEITPNRDMGATVETIQSVIAQMEQMPEYQRAFKLANSASAFGTLPDIGFATRDQLRSRIRAGLPLMAAGADASDIIPIDQRLYPPVNIPVRKVRLIDLISVGATDSDLVRWAKQTVRTDAAAATAIGVASPESTYTWVKQDSSVHTITHFAKAPRENLADLGQLQTLMETQLSTGLDLKLESLIASGDGMGENFTGIYSDSTVQSQTLTRNTTTESRLTFIHRMITAVRLQLFDDPNGIGIHPTDYHNTIVEQSSAGGYLLAASAASTESPSLWGVPCVVSPIFTQGTPIAGQFKTGATMWLREGGNIRISDSNEDDFLTRLIAVLAELRAAFAVVQPLAFVPGQHD